MTMTRGVKCSNVYRFKASHWLSRLSCLLALGRVADIFLNKPKKVKAVATASCAEWSCAVNAKRKPIGGFVSWENYSACFCFCCRSTAYDKACSLVGLVLAEINTSNLRQGNAFQWGWMLISEHFACSDTNIVPHAMARVLLCSGVSPC